MTTAVILRLPYYLAIRRRAYDDVLRADPCAYCRGGNGTVDHIVARANGGGNTAADVIGACPACNQEKGTRSLLHYLLERSPEPREYRVLETLRIIDGAGDVARMAVTVTARSTGSRRIVLRSDGHGAT